jgi:hypothetical protein
MTAEPDRVGPFAPPGGYGRTPKFRSEIARAMTDAPRRWDCNPTTWSILRSEASPGARKHAAISMVSDGWRSTQGPLPSNRWISLFRVRCAVNTISGEGSVGMQALAESDVVLANNLSEDQRLAPASLLKLSQ